MPQDTISMEKLLENISKIRDDNEITYINFPLIPKEEELNKIVSDDVQQIPEYKTLVSGGQLDGPIIKHLSKHELNGIIRLASKKGCVYVNCINSENITENKAYTVV